MNDSTLETQTLKIKIQKPSQDEAHFLGIPSFPQSIGKWSPWECEPKVFDWDYDETETAYIYEGSAKIITPSEEVHVSKGDLVRFPKGLKSTWNILQTIKKVYTINN